MAGFTFTRQASALFLNLVLPTSPAPATVAEVSLPHTADRSALISPYRSTEVDGIGTALAKFQDEWRSLPGEAEQRLLQMAQGLSIPRTAQSNATLYYVPSGDIITTVTFTLPPSRQGLAPEFPPDTVDRIKDQCAALRELREAGYVNESILKVELIENGTVEVQLYSFHGGRAATATPPVDQIEDFSTPEGRAEIWARNLAIMRMGEIGELPHLINHARGRFGHLQTLYRECGDDLSARLTSGILAMNVSSPAPLREYVDEGRVTGAELATLPTQIRHRIEFVNYLTRNLPTREQLATMAEQVSAVELPPYIESLLSLEEGAQCIDADTATIARIELKSGVKYVRERCASLVAPTPHEQAAIVRDYFEGAFPSDYRFLDLFQGLGTGVMLRRTDCSSRALIGLELLREMGADAGAEILLPYEGDRVVPGLPGHMYNFIVLPDGSRLYVDFTAPQGEVFTYADNEEIKAHYVGDSGVTPHVLVSSTERERIYGAIIREPVQATITSFTEAFGASGKNLQDFLHDAPEWTEKVEKLRLYSAKQDAIFGTSETPLWEEGSQASVRKLYKDWF